MTLFFRALVVSSFLFSAIAHAADDKAATQLRKNLDAMNTLQGNFLQVIKDEKGEVQEESSGEFMMMRPGKFYWKTVDPMPQVLVSNNKTIWLYDPDLETVNQREFSDDLRETPALLLSEDVEKLRKNFSISVEEKAEGVEQFSLTPKVTEGLFQQLVLVFTAGQLSEFVIQDTLGQVTRCTLSNVKRNQPLPEEKFFFIPPAGVEIIKN
jgi:outer membrane lipoprotein carrier protein